MGLLGTRAPLVYFSCSFQKAFCLNNTLPTLGLSSLFLGNPGSTPGDDEGNVFIRVCHSVHGWGVSACFQGGLPLDLGGVYPMDTHPRAPPPGQKTPRTPHWTHRHTHPWSHTPPNTHTSGQISPLTHILGHTHTRDGH